MRFCYMDVQISEGMDICVTERFSSAARSSGLLMPFDGRNTAVKISFFDEIFLKVDTKQEETAILILEILNGI